MIVDEKNAVQEVIEQYVDCWVKNDYERFITLFDPAFVMMTVKDGKVATFDANYMVDIMKAGTSKWDKYSYNISHIQIAGPVATVELDEFGFRDIETLATDFFHLSKVDGKWLISAKTYAFL